jgi:hypothetical protein
MLSWSDLIKNSNQESEKLIKTFKKNNNNKEVIKNKNEVLILHHSFSLKNEDEEFDYKFNNNLTDIIVEFKDLLNSVGVNVINNKISNELYDFIKYNSYNYNDVIDEVDKYNDMLEKEYEEELEEEEENNYYYR